MEETKKAAVAKDVTLEDEVMILNKKLQEQERIDKENAMKGLVEYLDSVGFTLYPTFTMTPDGIKSHIDLVRVRKPQ